ncbi:hypothetical protein WJ97_12985 [Burkholderia ubonensis]|uniref:hypothetical protein n=1 Tax=Burkholderia ubonensis TaxID=101571 RepID=UPI000751D261|nr:hypothetical protein [Burkholderia ubonensis]KVP96789.1 hypothetical protein WJ97_12985 [Burkholderia ubonensis]
MGFRTLVLLHNDEASKWSNDPTLGKQIMQASSHAMSALPGPDSRLECGGRVVSCQHADSQTLAIVSSYDYIPVANGHWHPGQQVEDMKLRLLKEAADALGYRLVKKSEKSS